MNVKRFVTGTLIGSAAGGKPSRAPRSAGAVILTSIASCGTHA